MTTCLTSDGPIAWRVSWTCWQGYNSAKKNSKKSRPEFKDFSIRAEAEAYKSDLMQRYSAVTACISPCYIAPRKREKEYAARQGTIAADWPPQARKLLA